MSHLSFCSFPAPSSRPASHACSPSLQRSGTFARSLRNRSVIPVQTGIQCFHLNTDCHHPLTKNFSPVEKLCLNVISRRKPRNLDFVSRGDGDSSFVFALRSMLSALCHRPRTSDLPLPRWEGLGEGDSCFAFLLCVLFSVGFSTLGTLDTLAHFRHFLSLHAPCSMLMMGMGKHQELAMYRCSVSIAVFISK